MRKVVLFFLDPVGNFCWIDRFLQVVDKLSPWISLFVSPSLPVLCNFK